MKKFLPWVLFFLFIGFLFFAYIRVAYYSPTKPKNQPQYQDGFLLFPFTGSGYPVYKIKVAPGWDIVNQDIYDNHVLLILGKKDHSLQITRSSQKEPCSVGTGNSANEDFPRVINLKTSFEPDDLKMLGSKHFNKGENSEELFFISCRLDPEDESSIRMISGTRVGTISYYLPVNYDKNLLEEMNEMVKSIQVINL